MSQKRGQISFEYDPALLDEVVTHELRLLEHRGSGFLALRYRAAAESIYRLEDESERERGFAELNSRFWEGLGFKALISEALDEYGQLRDIRRMFLGKAYHHREEEADLIDPDGAGTPSIGIKVMAEQFWNRGELREFLRHEFMHVADMRDPEFGYRREALRLAPMHANIIRERYRVLWDIYVDSRLLRAGVDTVGSSEARFREFTGLFEGYTDGDCRGAFDALWSRERLTHAEILELAVNPQLLWPDTSPRSAGTAGLRAGSACPLCGFSTIAWPTIDEHEAVALTALIQHDFPDWQLSQGLCERCLERYRMDIEANPRLDQPCFGPELS